MGMCLKEVMAKEIYKEAKYIKLIDYDKKPIETDNNMLIAPVLYFTEFEDGGLLIQLWVYNHMPDGWHEDRGALTAPRGFFWITNGKSWFGGERKNALMRVTRFTD